MKLHIEKMVYGGEGLARWQSGETARSKTAFVPFVLEDEWVEAEIVQDRGSFVRARLQEIQTPSPHRIAPACPYFQSCGGCHYQHSSYEHQLSIKERILREALLRIAKLDWQTPVHIHSASPWNYRNRTRLHLGSVEGSRRMGYYRFGSHQLLAIQECPISSFLINRAIKALGEGDLTGIPGDALEVEFFVNGEDTRLLLEIYSGNRSARVQEAEVQKAFEQLKQRLPELGGATLFGMDIQQPHSSKRLYTWGDSALQYEVAGHDYQVSSGSFFQVNRLLARELIAAALHNKQGRVAVDLYAGVGLFSLAMAKSFDQVIAVEAAPQSSADLIVNARNKNIRVIEATTEDYLHRKRPHIPDFVLVDPPRSGLGKDACRALATLQPKQLTYVSCDPSTLSRDLLLLLHSGYRVEEIHLLDLFPQTLHLESVVHLSI